MTNVSKQETILIVDDSQLNRRILSELLIDKGFAVIETESGREAIQKLQQQDVDLILLDVVLPEMDGYQVCKTLRKMDNIASIPIIFLTAVDNIKNKVKGLTIGGQDYVTKPFNETELLVRVQTQLTMMRQIRQITVMNRQLAAMNQQLLDEINEKDKIEAMLAHMNRELENKVRERTTQVENLLLQKDQFINQLSHDLKTPLTPIMTVLSLLAEDNLLPDLEQLIHIALHNARHMDELIRKVLRLARLNSSQPNLQISRFDFSKLIEETLSRYAFAAAKKNLQLASKLQHEKFIEADKTMLSEVVDNLVSNAIKYTDAGKILLTLHYPDQTNICLKVQDTGMGISSEHCQHLFNEFYKLDSSRHDRTSTGLGLSITKRIVEHHRGHIHVYSNGPDTGTTFTVILPIKH